MTDFEFMWVDGENFCMDCFDEWIGDYDINDPMIHPVDLNEEGFICCLKCDLVQNRKFEPSEYIFFEGGIK